MQSYVTLPLIKKSFRPYKVNNKNDKLNFVFKWMSK